MPIPNPRFANMMPHRITMAAAHIPHTGHHQSQLRGTLPGLLSSKAIAEQRMAGNQRPSISSASLSEQIWLEDPSILRGFADGVGAVDAGRLSDCMHAPRNAVPVGGAYG
jgi:hypothetical protein